MATLAAIAPRRDTGPATALVFTLVLGVVAFVVLYPALMLLHSSFQVGLFGQTTQFGFANWTEVFNHRKIGSAVANTLSLSATRQLISFFLGVMIAWAIARSDLPGGRWLEMGFWIALFMPALPVAMAWVLLFGGRSGVVNMWIEQAGLAERSPFNVYSWWGIVWVHLMTSTLPVKIFLFVPAFRNMDAALEEASRASGAGLMGTLFRVVVPIMLPTIVVVMMLGMIRSMQAFEIELFLGTPADIDVYSTMIYRAINQQPPLYGSASALAVSFLAMIAPFVILQQWYAQGRSHATLSGKYSGRVQPLGAWRWPIFSAILFLVLLMTVLPTLLLLMGTFMKIFGKFDLDDPWTTRHWITAWGRRDIARSFWNTINLGFGASLAAMAVYALIAYIAVKTDFVARRALDFLTWLPTIIPGIVISLGVLQMFVGTPFFRPLYGTIWVLIIAIMMGSMTVGVQIIKAAMTQVSRELEEASWTVGASRLYTFRRVVLPLVAPAILVVGLEVFAAAVSAVSIIALLGTGANQPLSILQLVYLDSGRFEPAAVVGVVITLITITAAVLARAVSRRTGLARYGS